MDIVSQVLESTARESEKYKSITVNKHLDLEYDLGSMLATDTNDFNIDQLRKNKNDYLLSLTRDNTQLLLNLIWELPTDQVDDVLVAKLPPQKTLLPRMKPIPKPKPLTKWQQFAKDKGIDKKKKSKLSWDEQLQKWVPLYGFKRAKAQREKDWVLEVPANVDPMEDQFAKKIEAKGEKVAKNELQRLRNIARAKKVKVPRMGTLTPEVLSCKDLQTAVTVAKASTASMGKFQAKLPKEKEAVGVSALIPGGNRKRKAPPVSGDAEKRRNLEIVDAILNKKPKLHMEKAVAKHIHMNSTEKAERKESNKAGKPSNSKKKKGEKGKRKMKGGGRKRR